MSTIKSSSGIVNIVSQFFISSLLTHAANLLSLIFFFIDFGFISIGLLDGIILKYAHINHDNSSIEDKYFLTKVSGFSVISEIKYQCDLISFIILSGILFLLQISSSFSLQCLLQSFSTTSQSISCKTHTAHQ
jgi:hypothetical protein